MARSMVLNILAIWAEDGEFVLEKQALSFKFGDNFVKGELGKHSLGLWMPVGRRVGTSNRSTSRTVSGADSTVIVFCRSVGDSFAV